MKRYSLLIIMFALMILGLGNYTFGQAECEQQCPGQYTASSVDGQIVCNCAAGPGCKIADCNPTKNASMCVQGSCKKCTENGVCCGVKLNTSIPFIGNCIESSGDFVGTNEEKAVTGGQAFPVLMGSLTKILVTVILIVSFVMIVIGGIMIATGDPSGGRKLIMKVVIGIALLGSSGVILRLINPNFFK